MSAMRPPFWQHRISSFTISLVSVSAPRNRIVAWTAEDVYLRDQVDNENMVWPLMTA